MRRAAQDLLIGAAFSALSGLALLGLSKLQSARPAAAAKPPLAARSPGVPPFSPSPTGLELADLSFDSLTSIKAAARAEPQLAHDPR
ncbi:MAG TPA: hypothetical protein VF294_03870, partial [Polyangiaceae bacterium]